MNFDDPKPPSDKRKQLLIYVRPSLKAEMDRLRGNLSRSLWIERTITAALQKERTP